MNPDIISYTQRPQIYFNLMSEELEKLDLLDHLNGKHPVGESDPFEQPQKLKESL